ncbi:kinesin-like protein KIF27 isoform X2 [Xenia sp. Carnegie-2017]|uniref:kinesin-like protein KIF27 isoform X2 n=1 Tax=Xenia sp. Carnegie-2017 TaxID=2897299 RepID=UPI001F03EE4E|nr:kinesin-like protein KIF27 isoform X2 [Xenia sp. Carnegie-2017]
MEEVPVRVAVRVRPLVGQERTHNVPKCITFVQDKQQLILGKDKAFTFDFVFQPSVTQEEVYETCVEPLVKGCFNGYNATVFAYGQTGSGKTYTIGSSNTADVLDEEYGMIPRALDQMFHIIQEKKGSVDLVVSASYIEIYMEEVRDLLDLETAAKDIHIREDENGNTVIMGATEQVVTSVDEAMSCLDTGAAGRHVGSTNMNEHSSRSHAIFTLYIEQHMIQKEERATANDYTSASDFMSAKFHFVDLAGSERAHRTGNVGERFKESVHINSGLLALGNVISALSDAKKKTGHIPYRDSKITRILKDSLGGNARTVMLTCVSPAAANLAENLNSLKYASRARYIKNKPVVNRDPQAAKMAEMQDEIQALREELQRTRAMTIESVSDVSEGLRMKEFHVELERAQQELETVRGLLDEATALLDDVRKGNGMNKTQMNQYERLRKGLESLKKQRNVAHQSSFGKQSEEIIQQLKKQLEKCKNDLAADNEIFAKRSTENDSLRTRIKELELENFNLDQQLREVMEKLRRYDEQLLKQQVQLNTRLATPEHDGIDEVHEQKVEGHVSKSPDDNDEMDRMMRNFRARNDLLVRQYEDEDVVRHSISDSSDSEQEEKSAVRPSKTLRKAKNKEKSENGVHKRHVKSRQLASNFRAPRTAQSTVKRRSELAKETKTIVKGTTENEEIQNLRLSVQTIQSEVHDSDIRLREAHIQLRDLNINIKLKEELIKELVRNDKEANHMKETFAEKVELMVKEVDRRKKDLDAMKKTLTHYEVKSQQEQQEKQKMEQEYKKKLEGLEEQLNELKRKQKDNERVSALYDEREKKLSDLEHHVERMRQQQGNLHKRLKEEMDKKTKMEREFQKDQQRIKELEDKNIQNEKILKRKTEEVVAANRKLRRKTSKEESEEAGRLDQRRQWLDTELENVLAKKQAMDALQEELDKREAILKEREQMIKEKSSLEMKKLRSSQVLSKDVLRMSTQLENVEKSIREIDIELKESDDETTREELRKNIDVLKSERSELITLRKDLDSMLREGSLLSVEDERRLLEYNEGIEALDAAIEFKTDFIDKQRKVLNAEMAENGFMTKLNSLGREDAIFLLSKYFQKVIGHREIERKQRLEHEDLILRVNEQDRVIRELERGFQQADLRAERRLTDQAKEFEHKAQFYMKQVNELEQHGSKKESRISELEKDLYYYKKISRDLKRKLRELTGNDGGLDSIQFCSAQSEAPSQSELKQPVESAGQEQNSTNVMRNDNGHPSSTTPVRVSRKDLRQLSEKELSVRRVVPLTKSDVTSSNATRKSSVDRVSVVRSSVKNSPRQKKSVEVISLQDSIEQSGNPWT